MKASIKAGIESVKCASIALINEWLTILLLERFPSMYAAEARRYRNSSDRSRLKDEKVGPARVPATLPMRSSNSEWLLPTSEHRRPWNEHRACPGRNKVLVHDHSHSHWRLKQ